MIISTIFYESEDKKIKIKHLQLLYHKNFPFSDEFEFKILSNDSFEFWLTTN